jgi:hypothetical protein
MDLPTPVKRESKKREENKTAFTLSIPLLAGTMIMGSIAPPQKRVNNNLRLPCCGFQGYDSVKFHFFVYRLYELLYTNKIIEAESRQGPGSGAEDYTGRRLFR